MLSIRKKVPYLKFAITGGLTLMVLGAIGVAVKVVAMQLEVDPNPTYRKVPGFKTNAYDPMAQKFQGTKTPSPTPTPTPSPSSSPNTTAKPKASLTPTPKASTTPTPSVSASPTPSPTPTPSPPTEPEPSTPPDSDA